MNKLFSRWKSGPAEASELPPVDYEVAKARAADTNPSIRLSLAERTDMRPEILYYLAEDKDPAVRRAIAANSATPVQADVLLSRDEDEQVRCVLAEKIARLTPELSDAERERIGDLVVDILETLARDTAPQVRRILAEELKSTPDVDPGVIRRLAEDEDISVAGPVLTYSPLLDDTFLAELIRSTRVAGAVASVSQRQNISADLCDTIAEVGDTDAVAALLSNKSAQIREETLDALVDAARPKPSWHAPLTTRPKLSMRSVKALAGFVADRLLSDLQARKDLDTETAKHLKKTIERRVAEGGDEATKADAPVSDDDEAAAMARAEKLHKDDKLDERTVSDAAKKGDKAFVVAALSLAAGVKRPAVYKIFSLQTAKGIVSLTWKAGFSMKLAETLQSRLAHIQPGEVLKARGGRFPLSEDDMTWQLEFLGG